MTTAIPAELIGYGGRGGHLSVSVTLASFSMDTVPAESLELESYKGLDPWGPYGHSQTERHEVKWARNL